MATELVMAYYTVDFRPGEVFKETFPRGQTDYTELCRECYESWKRCSLPAGSVKVVAVEDGWR